MIASGILVHLSGGYIELHFHFFVMVAVIALYQDWAPFLIAIGYVVLHHGLMGTLDPESVYNHPSAWAHPWRWAAIHGIFILGASAASLVNWRFNEQEYARRIAEQERGEERLRQSEARFRGLGAAGRGHDPDSGRRWTAGTSAPRSSVCWASSRLPSSGRICSPACTRTTCR